MERRREIKTIMELVNEAKNMISKLADHVTVEVADLEDLQYRLGNIADHLAFTMSQQALKGQVELFTETHQQVFVKCSDNVDQHHVEYYFKPLLALRRFKGRYYILISDQDNVTCYQAGICFDEAGCIERVFAGNEVPASEWAMPGLELVYRHDPVPVEELAKLLSMVKPCEIESDTDWLPSMCKYHINGKTFQDKVVIHPEEDDEA